MDFLHITKSGNVIDHAVVEAVDHLLLMEKKLSKWEFIAHLVRVWEKRFPELARSYASQTARSYYHGELKNKFGATNDLGMRRLADIPASLMDVLAVFYPDEVKTKRFLISFLKEFPQFAVPEKENL